jgi:hypothetical protein
LERRNISRHAGSGSTPTVGIVTMTRQGGQWTIEKQMSASAIGNLLLSH